MQDVWRVRFTRQYGQWKPQELDHLALFRHEASAEWAARCVLTHCARTFGLPGGSDNYPIRFTAQGIRMVNGAEVRGDLIAAELTSLEGQFLNSNGADIRDFRFDCDIIRTRKGWSEAVT
jgi:hypothetical protein